MFTRDARMCSFRDVVSSATWDISKVIVVRSDVCEFVSTEARVDTSN